MARKLGMLGALVVLAVMPSAAYGATRYVTVSGSGDACTQAAPCAIGVGIESAAPDDEVIVASGTYGSAAASVAGNIDFPEIGPVFVHGDTIGITRPTVFLEGGINMRGAGLKLQDMELRSGSFDSNATLLRVGFEMSADRVLVRATARPTAARTRCTRRSPFRLRPAARRPWRCR